MATCTLGRRMAPAVASGGQTVFSYNFQVFAATDLVVWKRLASDSSVAELVHITDYTVTGVGSAGGGTIVLVSGAAVGDTIYIEGNEAVYDRQTTWAAGGAYPSTLVNKEFNNLLYNIQELGRDRCRSVRLSPTDDPKSTLLPTPVGLNAWRWNSGATAIEHYLPVTVAGGSGTLNRLVKFGAGNTLVDSAVTDDGTTVDVATILRLGSTPITSSNAAGYLLLAALDPSIGTPNALLFFNGSVWSAGFPTSIMLEDDTPIVFGTGNDLEVAFSSANNRIEWSDGVNLLAYLAQTASLKGIFQVTEQFFAVAGTNALPSMAIGEKTTGFYQHTAGGLTATLATVAHTRWSAAAFFPVVTSTLDLGRTGERWAMAYINDITLTNNLAVQTGGQVLFDVGSVSAPGLAPRGEANSGIYSHFAGGLTLALLGVDKTRWSGTAFFPVVDSALDLGRTAERWLNFYTDHIFCNGKSEGAWQAATIASGAIAYSGKRMNVDTEAAAASDNLDSITGGGEGAELFIKAANSTRTVVLRDAADSGGNLKIGGTGTTLSLDNQRDIAHFIRSLDDIWQLVSFSNNEA